MPKNKKGGVSILTNACAATCLSAWMTLMDLLIADNVGDYETVISFAKTGQALIKLMPAEADEALYRKVRRLRTFMEKGRGRFQPHDWFYSEMAQRLEGREPILNQYQEKEKADYLAGVEREAKDIAERRSQEECSQVMHLARKG